MIHAHILYLSIHFVFFLFVCFLHRCFDISHPVCFFFLFCFIVFNYVNICIAKEYKETALGFCMKCMTLSKHWNELCKWKRGLFSFFINA